jgi:hypothetical protein
MKKRVFSVLAMTLIVIVAVTSPTIAKADNFSATGNGIVVNENITLGAPTGTDGVYNISAASGSFSDTDLGITNGTITGLYADQGALSTTCWAGSCGQSYTSMDGLWNYDNLFYQSDNSAGNPYPFDAWAGELFNVDDGNGNTYEVNIGGLGSGLQVWATNSGNYVIDGTTGDPLTATPEPSSLLLLGSGLLGMAEMFRRKMMANG